MSVEAAETAEITCPRCGGVAVERFYGPCTTCREALRATMRREGADVEEAVYEPKMNVVPNQVATKE